MDNDDKVDNNNNIEDKEELDRSEVNFMYKYFGDYNIVVNCSRNLFNLLNNYFDSNTAKIVHCLSVIFFLHGSINNSRILSRYQKSYLSGYYEGLDLSDSNIVSVLKTLGANQKIIDDFYLDLFKSSSDESLKNKKDGSPAILVQENNPKQTIYQLTKYNILNCYSTKANMSLYSRTFHKDELLGSSTEKLLKGNYFDKLIIILDNNIYSENDLSLIKKGHKYIAPLSTDIKEIEGFLSNPVWDEDFYYCKISCNNLVSCKVVRSNSKPSKKYYVYIDRAEAIETENDYLEMMEYDPVKFTKDNLEKKRKYYGIIVLETNCQENPKKVFAMYKNRWGGDYLIYPDFLRYEDSSEIYKQLDVDDIHYKDDDEIQGLSFIIGLIGNIKNLLENRIRLFFPNGSVKKILRDALEETENIHQVYYNGKWELDNITAQNVKLLEKMEMDLEYPLNKSKN